jgi:hypothetical protein
VYAVAFLAGLVQHQFPDQSATTQRWIATNGGLVQVMVIGSLIRDGTTEKEVTALLGASYRPTCGSLCGSFLTIGRAFDCGLSITFTNVPRPEPGWAVQAYQRFRSVVRGWVRGRPRSEERDGSPDVDLRVTHVRLDDLYLWSLKQPMPEVWHRCGSLFWGMPAHLTPTRTHGGIGYLQEAAERPGVLFRCLDDSLGLLQGSCRSVPPWRHRGRGCRLLR